MLAGQGKINTWLVSPDNALIARWLDLTFCVVSSCPRDLDHTVGASIASREFTLGYTDMLTSTLRGIENLGRLNTYNYLALENPTQ